MNFDSILFDLDGTLWDAAAPIAQAWSSVLVRARSQLSPYGKGSPLSAADIRALCGKTMDEITDLLFGDYPDRQALADHCYSYENEYLLQHPGAVYPGVPEALESLCAKAPLYIVSNCQKGYIEAFLQATGFARYFSGFLSFGDTSLPKGDNIRLLCERFALKSPVYVGDTQGDADAAAAAGVPFVYVQYGFGTVEHARRQLASPAELVSLL